MAENLEILSPSLKVARELWRENISLKVVCAVSVCFSPHTRLLLHKYINLEAKNQQP